MRFDDVAEALETTVKEDAVTKKILFAQGLLTYTNGDQFNVGMEGPSSAGKTYIAMEVARLFPAADVKLFAGISPTAFYNGGTAVEGLKYTKVQDFERKIVIFTDQPNLVVMEKMRPLLSHDKKELEFDITGTNLNVWKCFVKGYASFVYCSVPMYSDEQEKTRFLYVSPSEKSIKIMKALQLQMLKANDPVIIEKLLDDTAKRREVRKVVEYVKDAHVKHIRIDGDRPFKWFTEKYPRLQVRQLRDFPRLLSLIDASTLLNLENREVEEGTAVAESKDIDEGIALFEPIASCNELGLSPHGYEVWKEVLEPLLKERDVSYEDFQRAFFHNYSKALDYKQMTRVYIPSFRMAGLIEIGRDDEDKRKFVMRLLGKEEGILEEVESRFRVQKHLG